MLQIEGTRPGVRGGVRTKYGRETRVKGDHGHGAERDSCADLHGCEDIAHVREFENPCRFVHTTLPGSVSSS